MPDPNISVVIPVYNSSATLVILLEELARSLSGVCTYELILVDDRSADNSWQILQTLKQKYPEQLTAIRLSRNFGQHNAISCGISFAKGELVVTMDDDLQHPPAEIPKLLARYKETDADVVYGAYIDKRHEAWRNAGSWFLRKSSKIAEGNHSEATSFRLIRRELALKAIDHLHGGFVFIDEILNWYTSNIVHTPVHHHPRKSGKSTYTVRKLFKLYFDIVVNYSAVPLRWMMRIGLLASVVTFGMGTYFIYRKLFMHVKEEGFTALIVAVLFSTSVLMLCVGIIGQYLYKLYQIQNRRPPFSIDKVL